MQKTITWIILVFGMAVVLLIERDTHAQIQRQPPPGFGWREGVPIQLITKSSAVQQELGLSPDAVEKIAELQAQIAKESRLEVERISKEVGLKEGGWRLLSANQQEDLLKKWQEAHRIVKERNMHRVSELLNSEQQTRLHQIHLQAAGMAALSDAAVVKELRLSDDQQRRIRDAYHQSSKALIRHLKRGLLYDQSTSKGFDIELDKALLGVLSDDQKTAFEKLKGEPFSHQLTLP